MSTRLPKYRLHKGSGQALVQIEGQRIYLGLHGTKESRMANNGSRRFEKLRYVDSQYAS